MDILLVEDSPGDIRLTVEAFRDANPAVHIIDVRDGTAAMAYLSQLGIYGLDPRPHLSLLD